MSPRKAPEDCPLNDTPEEIAVTPPATTTPNSAALTEIAKSLGSYGPWFVAVVMAAGWAWSGVTGTAVERAEQMAWRKGVDEKLTAMKELLEPISKRPIVTERDFNDWADNFRQANPTVKVPQFRSSQ